MEKNVPPVLYQDIEKNIALFHELLPIDKSFDIVARRITVGGKKAYYILIDGLVGGDVILRLFQHIQGNPTEGVNGFQDFLQKQMGNTEVVTESDPLVLRDRILAGFTVLLIDGVNRGLILDLRDYPTRNPEEPDLEKVTRGARDGMVETLLFNTALIRRRIRDKNLIYELQDIGSRSHTDVAIGYIEGLADPNLVDHIRDTLSHLQTDALIMGEKTLEELMIKKRWYNPFPQAKFTERPDVVSSHLLEGHVVILVDNSPSVMLFPATMFHFTQHSEDYYQNPLAGTFIRWIRFIAILICVFFTPTWLLLAQNPQAAPDWLQFLIPPGEATLPLFVQLLLVELNLEILRMASIHTPNSLTTAMGIIGGLILGEYAIEINLLESHTVLFMAISSLATYAVPSIEFGTALRIYRVYILLLTGLLNLVGFIIGMGSLFLVLFTTRSFSGLRYTWPLLPFDGPALANLLLRRPIMQVRRHRRENQGKPVK